jgi:hypothetical protein
VAELARDAEDGVDVVFRHGRAPLHRDDRLGELVVIPARELVQQHVVSLGVDLRLIDPAVGGLDGQVEGSPDGRLLHPAIPSVGQPVPVEEVLRGRHDEVVVGLPEVPLVDGISGVGRTLRVTLDDDTVVRGSLVEHDLTCRGLIRSCCNLAVPVEGLG